MSDDLEQNDARREGFRPDRPQRLPADGSRPPRRSDDGLAEPPPSGGSGAKTVLIVVGIVGLLGVCIIGTIVAGVIFALMRVRTAAVAMKKGNDYRQIALAIHEYHDRNSQFPPVAMKTTSG